MTFVNRISEQERLKKALSRNVSAFVVLYGRRRCGKSRLIRQVLTFGDCYFMADQSEATQQRILLAKTLGAVIESFDKVTYPDWETLFETLNLRLNKRITLCLDEFPYLVKTAPELASVIQKLMDKKDSLNFNLLLCGSSQQLMHGLVFDRTAPLFGRADEIMKIKPMKAVYLQEILKTTAVETIEEYSVWGGIPRYWELRLTENTLFEALEYHLFNSQGILYDEPVRLFLDDMRDTVHSFTILSLIAAGCNRLSEIAARLEKPATHLSAPIEKLLMLGYIERIVPFDENPKNSKKSLYKIADPFLNFYFRFVVPNRSFIEIEQTNVIINRIKEQFAGYVSWHWEKLCREAVPFLSINGVNFNVASNYWGTPTKDKPVEIDVVAESQDGKYLLVGECKWQDKMLDSQQLLTGLTEKATVLPFAKNKTIIPVLFLKNKTQYKNEKNIFFPDDILKMLKELETKPGYFLSNTGECKDYTISCNGLSLEDMRFEKNTNR
ncbi:MAG: ATP-binding protein [Prevotellaceae bacterium]|nr:ATP-binding protein [Prevotellaceae bacterium]